MRRPEIQSAALMFLALAVGGCGLIGRTDAAKDAHREAMTKTVNEVTEVTQALDNNKSVEEIEKLKPQAAFPLRLAVAQPLHGYADRVWTAAEEAEILGWSAPLRDAGLISEIVILPDIAYTNCVWNGAGPACALNGIRSSAARMRADAVLLVAINTEVDGWVNPLSILDLTIVGLWIVPAHHRDALSTAQAVLLDNRSEYLWAKVQGAGNASIVRPYAYVDDTGVRRSARLEALKALGLDLVKHAPEITRY